ncbi:hypothetical protein RirG_236850 [Rhizophagus irregularis DAOM 197198w]|uniref:Uncharacterized protein n=1 Tax=Rhizophagus irregularis (strain DAOM 197198w) TaxID=1432141 RepID=A0A015IJC8_RHIIW|nr:hypothetical protein RirG_236850 [Rhizophagus irregularis DAOM 197198w]
MTKIELAEISNEWESKKRLDFSGDIDDDFDEVFSGAAAGNEFDKEIGGDPNEEGNNNVSPGGLGPGDLDEDIGNEEDKNSVFSAATVDDEEGNNNVFPGADVGGLEPRNPNEK